MKHHFMLQRPPARNLQPEEYVLCGDLIEKPIGEAPFEVGKLADLPEPNRLTDCVRCYNALAAELSAVDGAVYVYRLISGKGRGKSQDAQND